MPHSKVISVASLVAGLAPPLLLNAAQKLWRRMRGIGFHTFEGNYPSLAEVPCGNGSYDDEELAQLIASDRLARLRESGSGRKISDSTGYLILPLMVSHFVDEPLTVLDFGGGAGVGLISILDHVPALDLSTFRYVIVETPAMCRTVREAIVPILDARLGASAFATVADRIPESTAGRVIVNVAGTIQYISDYRETLAALAKLSPAVFIVSQTPMTDGKTYARQQLNMPRKRLASWVFNRAGFLSDMKALGYRNVFAVDHDLPLTHKGAPGPSTMASFVFVK